MKASLIYLTAIGCFAAASCSNESGGSLTSSMSSVASPGNPGTANTLYWQEQTDMSRATCVIDKPTTRANCTVNPVKLTIAEVTRRATQLGQGAVDSAVLSIAAEVKALKDSDPSVVSLVQQIDSLTKQKTALQAVITNDTKLIETSAKEKAAIDEKIVADDEQLAAIAKQLQQTPNDQKLLELQAKLQVERQDFFAQSTAIAAKMQTVQRHLTYQQSTSALVESNLKVKQDELKKTADELVVYSPKLEQLTTAKNDVQASLENIPQVLSLVAHADITYHGNLLTNALQGALILLDRAFEPAMELKTGRYKVESGFTQFCPQKIEPVLQGGDVRIDTTLQTPCNGQKVSYVCDKTVCKNSTTRYFTVLDAKHYSYVEGNNKAVFVLDTAP